MEVLHGSYAMGTRGSPDIYTLRQTTCACGITINMLLYLYPNGYSIVLIVGLVLVILFVTYT